MASRELIRDWIEWKVFKGTPLVSYVYELIHTIIRLQQKQYARPGKLSARNTLIVFSSREAKPESEIDSYRYFRLLLSVHLAVSKKLRHRYFTFSAFFSVRCSVFYLYLSLFSYIRQIWLFKERMCFFLLVKFV